MTQELTVTPETFYKSPGGFSLPFEEIGDCYRLIRERCEQCLKTCALTGDSGMARLMFLLEDYMTAPGELDVDRIAADPEFREALFILFRLGLSFDVLRSGQWCGEVKHMIEHPDEFAKGEYVLSVACNLSRLGNKVDLFDRRAGGDGKRPDILWDNRVFAECKDKPLRSLGQVKGNLEDAGAQIAEALASSGKSEAGVIFIDLSSNVPIEADSFSLRVLAESTDFLKSTRAVHAVVITHVQLTADDQMIGYPMRILRVDHPCPATLTHTIPNPSPADVASSPKLKTVDLERLVLATDPDLDERLKSVLREFYS